MAGLNKVLLIGRLGKDPELRYTPNGTAVAKFSLATSERKKNQEGEWEENTSWHNIVVFGKLAEVAGQYLHKGRQVFIEGRITYSKWEDNSGITRYSTEIIVSNFQMLGKKEENNISSNNIDDEIPF